MKRKVIAVLVLVLACVFAVIAADEITINNYMRVLNGNFDLTRNIAQYKVSQAGLFADLHVQRVLSNAWEEISVISDITTNGYAFFRMITTNRNYYIDVGVQRTGSGYTNQTALMRLYGSDTAILPLHPTNKLYATAFTLDANGADLEVWINAK